MKQWRRSVTALTLAAAALLTPVASALEGEDPAGPEDLTGVEDFTDVEDFTGAEDFTDGEDFTGAEDFTDGEDFTGAEDSPITPTGLNLHSEEHNAYISGSGNYFDPDAEISRAEAAQILARLVDYSGPMTAVYSDVPADAWYAQAAGVMGSLGVLRAGETEFLPDGPIARGEFVHAVACFFPVSTGAQQFADVDPADPAAASYLSARAQGWLTGFEDGTLHPDQNLTRAEAVVLVNRALGREPDKEYIDWANLLMYLDVGPGAWYYYDIMEASVSHPHVDVEGREVWTGHTADPLTMTAGFNLINNWLYYYDGETRNIVRSGSVGNFDFDADGHFTSGNAALDARLRKIVQSETNSSMSQEEKLRALYVYTRDSFTYLRRSPYKFGVLDFMEKDALNMLETGYGNCYCYASVFWYLARWIGYDAKIYSGTVGSNHAPHCWVEINFDGKDYIFDTELEMAYHKKGRNEINLYKYIDVDHWLYIK